MPSLSAPAKLNLFLHITGRRPDGYHELQTVFQLLDYGDTLHFTPRQDGELHFSCTDPRLQGTDNLVVRAARLLQGLATSPPGCDIRLEKRLPAAAGLGGGSSDAATTLLALNQLWRCGLDQQALMCLGTRLGADVPVFVAGHSAWAEGIGERLQPLSLPERWYLVLTPVCEVATGEIFSHPELTRQSAPIRIPAFPFSGTRNDCEPVACLLHPEISQALDWLRRHAIEPDATVRMSGTGASVFAVFKEEASARMLLNRVCTGRSADRATALPGCPPLRSAFVARGIDHSPLYRELGLR